MLQKTTSYLLFGNQYCGIEHTSIDGKESINVTILKKTKKELTIEDTFEIKSIEDQSALIPKNAHAFLILNNENVITKRIENGQKEAIKLVQLAFPNININDFMYEVLVQNKVHFVSICRRSYIEDIIELYKSKGVFIINFSLGNLIIANITDFISFNTIITPNREIKISNNEICEIEIYHFIEKADFHYVINGLATNNKSIISVSAALTSVLGNHKSSTNFDTEKQQLKETFKNLVFFRQFLTFFLIFLFSALLINFLVFNHYFNKVSILYQTSQINQNTKILVTELNEKVTKSQKIVENLLNNNHSKSSYFINEIAQDLPISIQLKELDYQPLLKKIKSEEDIMIEADVMLVSGESKDSDAFSNWVSQLEKKEWLTKLEVTNYADRTIEVAYFKFKIFINHDW